MATPTLILGANNWAIEEDNILGYALGSSSNQYLPREISFTRGSDATYTDSTGVVRQACWNLLTYSEQLDNAVWGKSNITITANTAIAPDGSTSAETILSTASNAFIYQPFSATAATTYTFSVWVKAVSVDTSLELNFYTGGGASSVGAIVFTATDTWQRISVTGTYSSASATAWATIGGNASFSTGESIYVWGAQLVQGAQPLAYLRTTDRLNVPRVDSSTGSKALLLEPQRTNLALYSQQFDDAYWGKTNITISANATTSPDGTSNADTFAGNGVSGSHYLNMPSFFATTSGVSYTISIFAKKNTNHFLQIDVSGAAFSSAYGNFDLNSGVVGSIGGGVNATITSVGNGWYRCTITKISNSTGIAPLYLSLITASNSPTFETNTLSTSLYLWGAQVEVGAYATSYIKTTSATVTRLADSCSKTGISSLIGQTEGTVLVEFSTNNLETYTRRLFSLSDGTNSNQINLQIQANTTTLTFAVINGGAAQAVINTSSNFYTLGSLIKIAVAYKENDFAFYANGNQIGVDTLGSVPTCSEFKFSDPLNSSNFIGGINQAALFTTRLSNAELAELTTL